MRKSRMFCTLLALVIAMAGMSGFTTAYAGENVKITFWHCNQGIDDVQEAMAEAFYEKTGIEVEVLSLESAAYKEKVAIAAASNDLPDVFQQWCGSGVLASYVEAGKCLDLTELMTESGAADYWTEAAINSVTFNDKIYAMPGFDMMVYPIYYNTEILAQYGYENGAFPETIPELEALCDKLVEDGIIPFALANLKMWTGSYYHSMLVDRYGGTELLTKAIAHTDGVTFEDDAFTKAGEKLVEWIDKGYFPDGFNGLDHSAGDDRQLFYAGAAAMWAYPSGVQFMSSENPEMLDMVGVANFPWAEEVGVGSNAVVGNIGSTACCISAKSEHPEEAWEFLKMFMDPVYLDGARAAGFNPPTMDYEQYVSSEKQKKVLAIANEATGVQLSWDVVMPSPLGTNYNELSQALMGGSITVAEFNAKMEAYALELLGK